MLTIERKLATALADLIRVIEEGRHPEGKNPYGYPEVRNGMQALAFFTGNKDFLSVEPTNFIAEIDLKDYGVKIEWNHQADKFGLYDNVREGTVTQADGKVYTIYRFLTQIDCYFTIKGPIGTNTRFASLKDLLEVGLALTPKGKEQNRKRESPVACPHCGWQESIMEIDVPWEARSLDPHDRKNTATLIETQCGHCHHSFWS